MSSNVVYKLSDDAIAQIVKLLQLGILSGTDIADNFRTLALIVDGEQLVPSPAYLEAFEANMKKMQDDVDALSAERNVGFKGFD